MAPQGQHQEEATPACQGGGGQSIVELCRSSKSGLVFWSRQRFEIGVELQIRIRRDALPGAEAAADVDGTPEWVTVRGFVVECPPVRRPDGSHGFQVSLLLDQALMPPKPARARGRRGCPRLSTRLPGLARPGLN